MYAHYNILILLWLPWQQYPTFLWLHCCLAGSFTPKCFLRLKEHSPCQCPSPHNTNRELPPANNVGSSPAASWSHVPSSSSRCVCLRVLSPCVELQLGLSNNKTKKWHLVHLVVLFLIIEGESDFVVCHQVNWNCSWLGSLLYLFIVPNYRICGISKGQLVCAH